MTAVIETVARAIFVELGWEGVGAHPSYDHDPKPWEDAARAAILALRDSLTEDMLAAVYCSNVGSCYATEADARDCLQRVIDAAVQADGGPK